jgi:glycosyltransferase involved in cell wall biosynthesis
MFSKIFRDNKSENKDVLGLDSKIQKNISNFIKTVDKYKIKKVKRPSSIKSIEVLIPCYNHGKYLDEALKSIAWQGFKGKIFVTLIDDSSTDDTLNIMKNLKLLYSQRMNIKIIHNSKNLLQTGSLNKAIEVSENELFVVLNADDLLTPDCLELISSTYEIHKDIYMLGGSSLWFESSDSLPKHKLISINNLKLTKYGPQDAIKFNKLNSINMSQSSCSFFKSAWEVVGGYLPKEERVCSFDDRDFQMRVCSVLPVGVYKTYPMEFYRTDSSLGRATI